MKTLDFEKTKDIFTDYVLSSAEMVNVRGGDGVPDVLPPPPAVRI